MSDIESAEPSTSVDLVEEPEGGARRRCATTGARIAPLRMIRFVLNPEHEVTADLAAKLPGRGVWVSANGGAIEKAAKGAFAKAFRQAVRVPADLAASVEGLLVRRLLEFLGFARRAGDVTLGFTKVEMRMADFGRPIAGLVLASDGGASDRGKLLAPALRKDARLAVIGLLSVHEMSLAFGRENVVHAAFDQGGLAARIKAEAFRLSGFRPLIPQDWAIAAETQAVLMARLAPDGPEDGAQAPGSDPLGVGERKGHVVRDRVTTRHGRTGAQTPKPEGRD